MVLPSKAGARSARTAATQGTLWSRVTSCPNLEPYGATGAHPMAWKPCRFLIKIVCLEWCPPFRTRYPRAKAERCRPTLSSRWPEVDPRRCLSRWPCLATAGLRGGRWTKPRERGCCLVSPGGLETAAAGPHNRAGGIAMHRLTRPALRPIAAPEAANLDSRHFPNPPEPTTEPCWTPIPGL